MSPQQEYSFTCSITAFTFTVLLEAMRRTERRWCAGKSAMMAEAQVN
jgi:hypothetical protein